MQKEVKEEVKEEVKVKEVKEEEGSSAAGDYLVK